jgi:hypothetical protein
MEKLINKYEENLSILLKKYNVDDIMKIDDIQDRTRARDFRDFIEELKELHLFTVSSSRHGGMCMG